MAKKIETFTEFSEYVQSEFFGTRYGAWIFHGLANSDWSLLPAAGRMGREDKYFETKMLDEFKRRAVPHLAQPPTK